MSVFISWAGADREIKNVIAARLHDENIPYWDSDEHCVSDFSSECIRNIQKSQVFVVIVSDASMTPGSYVINEVIEAHKCEGMGILNMLVYKITDEPYTEQFTLQLNHISDANHVSRIQRAGSTGGIDTLVKRIKYLLKCRAEGTPEKPNDVLCPRIFGTAISTGGYFVKDSRNAVMQAIEQAYSRSNVVILSELFGFGKKSVIRKYVQSHGYRSAVEVQGLHDSLYRFFLNDLHFSNVNDNAFDTKDERNAIQKKFDLLQKLDKTTMLIISDVDVEDDTDEWLLGLLSNLRCHVAIITQNSADAQQDYFPVIPVGRMENKYLLELFFHYYDRENESDREQLTPMLEKFFEDIGGHTKTVEIAASVLSKEMRADPDELARYLASGENGNRTLTERIVEKLSALIAVENFSEDTGKALLLIALTANPIMDDVELYRLMRLCQLDDRGVITELDSHRWITYDARSRTVYIEPIIAQICVSKLLSDYSLPNTCVKYYAKQFEKILTKSTTASVHFIARMEHFFHILQMDEISVLFGLFRSECCSGEMDVAKVEGACDRFVQWYREECAAQHLSPSDRGLFVIHAATWARFCVLLPLKMNTRQPSLFSLHNINTISGSGMNEILETIMEETDAQELESLLSAYIQEDEEEEDSEENIISQLCGSISFDMMANDFSSVNHNLDYLLDFLQNHPQYCENEENADCVLTVAKVIAGFCFHSGAYHVGISFYEKILTLEFPYFHRHQLLMLYVRLLLGLETETALVAMEEAEDIFAEAVAKTPENERLGIKREHLSLYAVILSESGLADEAIEKLEELTSIGTTDVEEDCISAMIGIVDALLFQKRKEDAIDFVAKNRISLEKYLEKENASDDRKQKVETLVAIAETGLDAQNTDFAAGGIITDKNYYQRYSGEKKNNRLIMLKYNRMAQEVSRFDFSSYSNAQLAEHTQTLRTRAQAGESKSSLAPEAFALVSEAGLRTLGYRHHQVQYVGAAAMLDGKIAEILNGEGKTYTITLVAYVNSLYCKNTFILDDSKYLTERNYRWMRGLFTLLGVTVGHLSPRSRGKIDETDANILYSDFATFGFDSLRRESSTNPAHRRDLSQCCAIVDEADEILVESATTPISLLGNAVPSPERVENCRKAYALAMKIKDDARYCSFTHGYAELKRDVYPLIEKAFDISSDDIHAAEEMLKIKNLLLHALNCITAKQGVDYFVRGGQIFEENTRTGFLTKPSAERGYFLARAADLPTSLYENELCERRSTVNMVYVYGMLTHFGTLAGTSATASSFRKEFKDIYGLDVVAIPPVLPIQRTDETVTLFTAKKHKDAAILEMIREKHDYAQPILLIVNSVKDSQYYSRLLDKCNVPHTVLNAVNSEQSPELLAEAGVLGSVTVATQIANRGVDIKLGGDAERRTISELAKQGHDISRLDSILYSVPDEATRETDLYRSYSAMLEKNRALVSLNREKVIQAGGLCVISTDPYADMRIEQQIRGRAGRQGAVGESYIFESMDDEVFKILLGARRDTLFRLFDYSQMEIIDAKILRRSCENAKERMHHATFRNMKNAAEISQRLDKSKQEFLRFANGLSDGVKNAEANNVSKALPLVKELLILWRQDSDVDDWASFVFSILKKEPDADGKVQLLSEIIIQNRNNLKQNADPAVSQNNAHSILYLAEKQPAFFLQNTAGGDIKRTLAAAAKQLSLQSADRLKETLLKLASDLLGTMSKHLTAMQELESIYATQKKKNTDAILRETYEKDRNQRIADTISAWICNL